MQWAVAGAPARPSEQAGAGVTRCCTSRSMMSTPTAAISHFYVNVSMCTHKVLHQRPLYVY